jgi:hypothetical protein
MRNLDNTDYNQQLLAQQQEAARQAFEAQAHAQRAYTGHSGFGYGAGPQQYHGTPKDAVYHAAKETGEALGATERRIYDDNMRQTMHERNLLNAEAERRQYDSDTGRHSAVEAAKTAQYSAETGRIDSGYQHQGRMGMNEALKGLTAGVGGGNQAPGINLYGAGGQQIGGSRGPAVSPLKSLLER